MLSGPIAKLVEATLNNIPDTPKMHKVCIGTLRILSPGHLRAHIKAAVYTPPGSNTFNSQALGRH